MNQYLDQTTPPIWRPSGPSPVHSTGIAITIVAAGAALFLGLVLIFSGDCGVSPTADELLHFRIWFLADVVAFAAVPAGIGWWAVRRGREPLVWFALAGLSLIAGTVFAFSAEPIPFFCF